jgi:hypothetical protein
MTVRRRCYRQRMRMRPEKLAGKRADRTNRARARPVERQLGRRQLPSGRVRSVAAYEVTFADDASVVGAGGRPNITVCTASCRSSPPTLSALCDSQSPEEPTQVAFPQPCTPTARRFGPGKSRAAGRLVSRPPTAGTGTLRRETTHNPISPVSTQSLLVWLEPLTAAGAFVCVIPLLP